MMPAERPPVTATVLQLADGRSLAYAEHGDPQGAPVIAFHGTPGSRLQLAGAHRSAVENGVRLVLPDRPGYGHSTWARRRRLGDWADDVAALADHLGLDRFAVVGVSGGAPHALACASLLGPRVDGVGVVSGVGPVSAPALAASLGTGARAVLRLHLLWRPLARLLISTGLWAFHRAPRAMLALARWGMPDRDAEIVARPEVQRRLLAEAGVAPSPTTARAAAQDIALFCSGWGLPLGRIGQHVVLWHGDADTTVPVDHARHLARVIPRATLHVLPGEGHLLVEDRIGEVLAAVTTGSAD
jgi:pimeloyl-ACP methyl ester carboxylesterase